MSGGTALADSHPGVGALTALAFVLIIGRAERFQCGKQIAAYLGLGTLEDSSGKSATTGPYHEAREFDIALLAGGSGPSCSAQHSRMAQ